MKFSSLSSIISVTLSLALSAVASLTPDARFLTASDGTQVYAEAIGNPFGKHLVLAHGFALACQTMDALFFNPEMQAQFYMVRYDLRGHGQSGKPSTSAGYTSDKWADDFAALIKAFNLRDITYVAWSYSGTVVPDILSNIQPSPLKAVVSLSAVPISSAQVLGELLTPATNVEDAGVLSFNDTILALTSRATFVNTCFANPPQVPYPIRSEWLGFSAVVTPDIALLIVERSQDPTAYLAAAKSGALPVLVVGGALDAHVNVTALIGLLSTEVKNLESHIVPGAGHAVFYDNTQATVQYISNFVQRLN